MPTSIDESGDTGHAVSSLPYFRLAAVWMPSSDEAEAFRDAVRGLRRRFNLGAAFGFKFARTHSQPELRREFLKLALNHDFLFAVCSLDKTNAYWRSASAQEQHWATATSLAVHLRPVYHKAERSSHPLREPILVDDNQDRKFLKVVRDAFRGLRSRLHPNVPLVQKPRFRDSKPDEVMQLVDMLCGATGAALDGDPTFYDVVKAQCVGQICLP